jgi:hypothetical protein
MKLFLLSAGDNDLGIFFDPRNSEFYTFAAELEDEGDEQGEILLTKASQLAHSVCPKDSPTLEVTYMCS